MHKYSCAKISTTAIFRKCTKMDLSSSRCHLFSLNSWYTSESVPSVKLQNQQNHDRITKGWIPIVIKIFAAVLPSLVFLQSNQDGDVLLNIVLVSSMKLIAKCFTKQPYTDLSTMNLLSSVLLLVFTMQLKWKYHAQWTNLQALLPWS